MRHRSRKGNEMNELETVLALTDFGKEIGSDGFVGFSEGSKFFAHPDGLYYGIDPLDRSVHTYMEDGEDFFSIKVESFDEYLPIP